MNLSPPCARSRMRRPPRTRADGGSRASGRSGAWLKYCTAAISIGHKRHVVRGAKLAVRVLAARNFADQRAAARHRVAAHEVRVERIGPKARDQHRRHRRQEAGIDRFEQVLHEARLLGFDLQLDARRHEGKAFEQPLDIRVGDLDAVHRQARRDLRKLVRELRAHLAQVAELVVVVAQQARVHAWSPNACAAAALCRPRATRPCRLRGRAACAAAAPAAPAAPTGSRGSRTR